MLEGDYVGAPHIRVLLQRQHCLSVCRVPAVLALLLLQRWSANSSFPAVGAVLECQQCLPCCWCSAGVPAVPRAGPHHNNC